MSNDEQMDLIVSEEKRENVDRQIVQRTVHTCLVDCVYL